MTVIEKKQNEDEKLKDKQMMQNYLNQIYGGLASFQEYINGAELSDKVEGYGTDNHELMRKNVTEYQRNLKITMNYLNHWYGFEF